MMKRLLSLVLAGLILTAVLPVTVRAGTCCETAPTKWYYYNQEHMGVCSVCGNVTVERARHNYRFDVAPGCTICGYVSCGSMDHVPSEHDVHQCAVCHVIYEECPDIDGNDICDICGEYIHRCYVEYIICVPFEDGCHQVCSVCGSVHSEKWDHGIDPATGTCMKCGAACPHKYMFWEKTATEHYGFCLSCRNFTVEKGPHNTVDGVCTVCGYSGCTHSFQEMDKSLNNYYHELYCSYCEIYIAPWPTPHTYDENGVCTGCGFVECPHGTVEESKSITLRFNEKEHWYICNLCEYLYIFNEPHSFVDGVCIICGAKPCAGSHGNVSKGFPHTCLTCSTIIGCVDKNNNCKCDYCEQEYHNEILETTETHHRIHCAVCELESEWATHYDCDGHIGCDYCNYGRPKAEEKVELAPDTPETDVQIDTGALLTSEERKLLAEGVTVDVTVSVKNADETVTQEDQAIISAAIENSEMEQNVLLYLDIDLSKTVGDAQAANITETKAPITITITIPEELRGADRAFSVIRVHDGEAVELPDLDENPATVTIETDRFSTYALVYAVQENEKPDDPVDEPEIPGDDTQIPVVPENTTNKDEAENTENGTDMDHTGGNSEAPVQSGEKPKDNSALIVIVAAVAAVLIVASAVLVTIIKKRGKA